MGVAADFESVSVTDTISHALRRIDRRSGEVSTVAVPASLSEPEGLALADGKIYVADTNNHRIVSVVLG